MRATQLSLSLHCQERTIQASATDRQVEAGETLFVPFGKKKKRSRDLESLKVKLARRLNGCLETGQKKGDILSPLSGG